MISFYLRLTADGKPLNLDPYTVKGGFSRTITIAAEDDLNNFRGSQMQITLDDADRRFTSGAFALVGGEEILIAAAPPPWTTDDPNILWSGTIDPEVIERDPDSLNLTLRVLQHGSLLNTIEAGLPDWTRDADGNLILNANDYYRWVGKADQWVVVRNPDGTFAHNEIAKADEHVYYTPSARDALADEIYRNKFHTKVHHFHTMNTNVGGVEWPFPSNDGVPTGQFQQHLHPDFTQDPAEWDNTSLEIDYGSYIRNPNPTQVFRRQAVADIVAELVSQYNRTAKFQLIFEPADCVLLPPEIQQQIEILKRQPDVESTDLLYVPAAAPARPERTYFLINWRNQDPRDTTLRASIYTIENETELTPIVEDVTIGSIGNSLTWPDGRGLRFARTVGQNPLNPCAYTMRWHVLQIPGTHNDYALYFDLFSINWSAVTLRVSGPFSFRLIEELGSYTDYPLPPAYVINRAAFVNSNGTGTVRDPVTGEPYPPELPPAASLETNGRYYTTRQGGLTVSGALFDRVAVDAENTKLSAILSDLAKLTHSRWYVTANRRLKFISRQHPGSILSLRASRTIALKTFSRRFNEQDVPTIGSGLVVPENFRTAHAQWIRDHVLDRATEGYETTVPLEDLAGPPQVGSAISLTDPGIPAPANNGLAQKYSNRYILDSATIDIENETVTLRAELPTL